MDMVISLVESYGYPALIGGVAHYHLFPHFGGGVSDCMRMSGVTDGRKVIELAMKARGESLFIAGELSLADLFLAPIAYLVSLTSDSHAVFDVAGFDAWWTRIQTLPSFKDTRPALD
jgi:glutathione S-transferase